MKLQNACSLLPLVVFGLLSAAAYFALYIYSDTVVEFSKRVQAGEKAFALVPIGIAFTFSYLHGNFTSLFWDRLGFKPKGK